GQQAFFAALRPTCGHEVLLGWVCVCGEAATYGATAVPAPGLWFPGGRGRALSRCDEIAAFLSRPMVSPTPRRVFTRRAGRGGCSARRRSRVSRSWRRAIRAGTAVAHAAMTMPVPRVVIVGGGFGGLAAAKALRRAPVEVILIDRTNHHLFQPLLY